MRLLLLNLLRKPLRTFLTVFGVAVALFLFCFLEAVLEAFSGRVHMADASRLVVMHKEAITFLLPVAYRPVIEQMEGVEGVAPAIWFGGIYEEPAARPEEEPRRQLFAQFATDIKSYMRLYPEIEIQAEQFQEFLSDQTGCVLGEQLAERLGKRVGDRFTLRSTIWSRQDGGSNWDFTVRAIYTSSAPNFDTARMYFHYKYLDESRLFQKGRVGIFILGITDPDQYERIANAIDERFANSPSPTRTMTESAFAMNFVSMLGNLQFLLRSIGSAVVLTMLLVSANTMVMSARERTREMGILKALGFSDRQVAGLLVAEALIISLLGAVLGAGGAYVAFNWLGLNPRVEFFPLFYLPPQALAAAFGLALLTGLLSSLIPAMAGMRLKATDALRSV